MEENTRRSNNIDVLNPFEEDKTIKKKDAPPDRGLSICVNNILFPFPLFHRLMFIYSSSHISV